MLVLKKGIGSFLNKANHLCAEAWITVETVCHRLNLFSLLLKNLPASPKTAHLTGSQCQGPLCAPTIVVSVCFSIWTGWFSGPRSASAIPIPGSYQLPPPPQPLGCPLLWGLDAEEDENIPTAPAPYCQSKMPTPYLWQAHC